MSSILWVNDRPQCNINERRSLEALGIYLVLATSTEEALERVQKQHFDVIISDMRRPGDAEAGYTLLDKLRAIANHTPYIIYAGARSPEQLEEARKRGAIAATSRPNELFKIVLSALERKENG
nr:response regulator [Oscillatoria sp. FACHB-1406]